jgi:hypothetical protein
MRRDSTSGTGFGFFGVVRGGEATVALEGPTHRITGAVTVRFKVHPTWEAVERVRMKRSRRWLLAAGEARCT